MDFEYPIFLSFNLHLHFYCYSLFTFTWVLYLLKSQVVLHLQLRLGQCALLNSSLAWEYDNMQYSLLEFYCTCQDDGKNQFAKDICIWSIPLGQYQFVSCSFLSCRKLTLWSFHKAS